MVTGIAAAGAVGLLAQGVIGWHLTLRKIARIALPAADEAKIRDQNLRADALVAICLLVALPLVVLQGFSVGAGLAIESLVWLPMLVVALVQDRRRRRR